MSKSAKIQVKLNYGTGVCVLPSSVLDMLDKAKKFDIKVLMLIASNESFRSGNYLSAIAKELSCEESDVSSSISFWNGAGLISLDDINAAVKETKKPSQKNDKDDEVKNDHPKRAKVTELPQYTSSELNSLLEKHRHVVELIDECQNILRKIFTAADIKVLMALVDYLGLDNDYILVLMHYAARIDMRSLRYIEKMAVNCLDDGYTDAKELQKELHEREERATLEGKIRSLFGIGTRKLTAKERKHIEAWLFSYKFETDVIEKAYEITIGATGKASIPYTNAILEKWYTEGARNLADVQAILEKREEEGREEGSSFNVDEFFDAALKRSYSDKK